MQQEVLRLESLTKTFDNTRVLSGVSLGIQKGEFVTLLGPSGCGKTTTLRIIAGLTEPDSGRVFLDGRDVTELPPEKRPVNTVFQNYALFPHMTVERNIGYALRIKGVGRREIKERVNEMLELVKLPGYGQRRPAQLSGGQRQRVAIARSVISNPLVLLLDEPLGALDLKLRQQMQEELKSIQQRLGITFVYITHDQEEALNMSDRIGVMNAGRLEQVGTPEDVYERPNTRFVAGFVGSGSLFEGVISQVDQDGVTVVSPCGTMRASHKEGARVNDAAAVSVHAERIHYSLKPQTGFDMPAIIRSHRYAGSTLRTELTLCTGEVIRASGAEAIKNLPQPGQKVFLSWQVQGAALITGGDAQ